MLLFPVEYSQHQRKELLYDHFYRNYRWILTFSFFLPVLNLSFLSKIIGKVVANGLFNHNIKWFPWHHAVCALTLPHHSTCSPLSSKWYFVSRDKISGVFLALIDLSAAFDTIDNTILLDFLKERIWINGNGWNWILSYLSSHTQQVWMDDVVSELTELLHRVSYAPFT